MRWTVGNEGQMPNTLQQWRDARVLPRQRGQREREPSGLLRFAFYGRFSTVRHQHLETSHRWQRDCAVGVIDGHGVIVSEYLDVGVSRRRSWFNRPRAAALLAAASSGDAGFDAVVVGEYERAFWGRQAFHIVALLNEHRIGLWLPETLGPVDLADPVHRTVIIEIGARSAREIARDRHRALEAMRVQAQHQGRYLGGRPPYGYRLADAGPHPNPDHARWGRQQQHLEPDPVTAPNVQWIFSQRLAGRSMTGITRALNDRAIPSPSAHDRARNAHRTGTTWNVTTVAAILANPRYTGRQVWNRQPRHYRDDTNPGSTTLQRRRVSRNDWVISDQPAHQGLVSEPDFVAAQTISALPGPVDGNRRCYQLVGVVRCGLCDRRMESHWAHSRPGYRCRHGRISGTSSTGRPTTLYWREDRLLQQIGHALRVAGWGDDGVEVSVADCLRCHHLTVMCERSAVCLRAE
ncbi:recombinase [Actinoplanes italicus]|uniref:Recombinase n=2 Tax=Actinoplanes italicus TaxID=113567 RepID=A0A2T0JSA5_9ACTN|nr:recombinase [Actinoplanes italicus]